MSDPHPEQRPDLRVVDGGLASRPTHDEREKLCDHESEDAVIANILITGDLIDEVQEFLEPEHFDSEANRWMYTACCALREANLPIDNVKVGAWLREQGRLSQVGGWAALTAILNAAPALGAARLRSHATTVRDRWIRRQTRDLAMLVEARCISEAAPVETIIIDALTRLQTLTDTLSKSDKDHEIKQVIRRTVDKLQQIHASGGKGLIRTGFDRLDRITSGLHAEFTLLAGRPGSGKTSFACEVAINVASVADDNKQLTNGVYLASLETHDETLMMRLICAEGSVSLPKMRSGGLTPLDWQAVTDTCVKLAPLPIWLDDSAGITVQELWTRCRRASASLRAKGKKLSLVIIDYVQLLRLAMVGARLRGPPPSREQVVSEVARTLAAMCSELGCCVMALAQLNRDCEKRADKRPIIADLRESGELEQAARTIIFVYREAYYDKSANENAAELIVAKQNNGPTGTAELWFDPRFARFENLPDDYEPEPQQSAKPAPRNDGGRSGSNSSNAPTAARKPEQPTQPKPKPMTLPHVPTARVSREVVPSELEVDKQTRMREMLNLVTPAIDVAGLRNALSDHMFLSDEDADKMIGEAVQKGLLRCEGDGEGRKYWRS